MIMKRSKIKLFIVIVLIGILCSLFLHNRTKAGKNIKKIVHPSKESISLTVVTTGIVEPQNRLEVKPSISGRIEQMLIDEGDKVQQGQTLAWMSSTERAALIDAASSQGDEVLDYWEEVYKKTPIISPITGEVIVRVVEPGQTVTSAEPILVLSDRLIIKAQFDETDIGRVRKDQAALITLDAYPDVQIEGVVDHIAYESEIVNNVTIYEVDILPKHVPEILRSGMSVTVEIIERTSQDALTIPSEAVNYDGKSTYVLVQQSTGKIVQQDVVIGLSSNNKTEIVSGLSINDKVAVFQQPELAQRKTTGSNPFMPSRKNK
ncbi:MAG: efflux RND transporter periplasmic adaptor subunit [Candidatus Omnitrophica bacterium]|nr:efflux RND transporter periplasmic adaptor subunit [Candidatus Omnitrophota bacterium]